MPGDGSEPPTLHSASVQRLVHKEPVHNLVLLQFAPYHGGLSMSCFLGCIALSCAFLKDGNLLDERRPFWMAP
jgi:hypothetical protein